MSKFVDQTYINKMDADQLRRELVIELERSFALAEAFRDLPEVPSHEALYALSELADWPRDWPVGKALQRAHGLDAVLPVSECEKGAGLWSIIRAALIAAKQQK